MAVEQFGPYHIDANEIVAVGDKGADGFTIVLRGGATIRMHCADAAETEKIHAKVLVAIRATRP